MTRTFKASAPAITAALLLLSTAAEARPTLMSADWAKQVCAAWNGTPELTDELVGSGWASNDKDRGYKVIHVYRSDCEHSPPVEMRISVQDGKARCVYGGAVENPVLDDDVDYLMHATTERWQQMGTGEYGPMIAMLFRRLKFDGPKWEAMKNMGPFAQFLLLTGAVESDSTGCP